MRSELYPLVFKEIPDFDLIRAHNHGLLPKHYISENPAPLISAYIGSYLQDEIVNYSNIATDCGVSAPTIREYFHILEETQTPGYSVTKIFHVRYRNSKLFVEAWYH